MKFSLQPTAPRPECIFCDGPADTTINNGKTDCCRKCKEQMRRENEEASEVSFENMAKLVEEMQDVPVASKIMLDPKALHLLKEFAGEVAARNSQVAPFAPPPEAISIYGGMPVYVDKTLKPGQWQAVDRHGNVLEEGNLLPGHLRSDSSPTLW